MVMLGWCPGSLSVADTFAQYPGTKVVRVYRGASSALPSWTGTILAPIVSQGATTHLSFKIWDLAALTSWLDQMPAGHKLILTYAHEPEQGTSAGDPDPATFRSRWLELVQTLETHPARSRITLAPVYTHYYWDHNASAEANFWPASAAYGIDAVGWDVYNESSTGYEDPGAKLKLPRDFAAKWGKPYLVAEYGAYPPANPVRAPGDNGTGAADWIRGMVSVMRADDALSGTYFHFGSWDPIANNYVPERNALAEVISVEAGTTPPPSTSTGISHVAEAHAFNSSTTNSVAVSKPTGVADGDFLIGLMGYIGISVTVTDPPLTLLGTRTDGTDLTSKAYTRKAASEPSSYTWTLSDFRKNGAWVGAYRGQHATTPVAASASSISADGTTHTAPSVAVPDGGWLITMVVSRHTHTGTTTTWTSSAGDTKRWEAASNQGSFDLTAAVWDSGPLAAGTYARTITANQTQSDITLWSIALAPAPATTTVSADLVPGVPIV